MRTTIMTPVQKIEWQLRQISHAIKEHMEVFDTWMHKAQEQEKKKDTSPVEE
jgi:hypothetical protein